MRVEVDYRFRNTTVTQTGTITVLPGTLRSDVFRDVFWEFIADTKALRSRGKPLKFSPQFFSLEKNILN